MPIFMDRHDVQGVTDDTVHAAHEKDLEMQDKYQVNFLTYWFDQKRGSVFCLVDAPDRETIAKVHGESHGLIPNAILEVDLSDVESFLGRIADSQDADQPADKKSVPIDSAFRCLLFTDLKGSTSISRTIGDLAAIDLLESHDKIIRSALATYRGREVKHTGDGFMASFRSVSDAVKCAVEIQQQFHRFNQGNPQMPLHVRVGINAGEPVERGHDLFGMTVQLAARVCDHADPGKILVTGVIYELSKETLAENTTFRKSDKARFKGFEHAIQLYEVDWQNN